MHTNQLAQMALISVCERRKGEGSWQDGSMGLWVELGLATVDAGRAELWGERRPRHRRPGCPLRSPRHPFQPRGQARPGQASSTRPPPHAVPHLLERVCDLVGGERGRPDRQLRHQPRVVKHGHAKSAADDVAQVGRHPRLGQLAQRGLALQHSDSQQRSVAGEELAADCLRSEQESSAITYETGPTRWCPSLGEQFARCRLPACAGRQAHGAGCMRRVRGAGKGGTRRWRPPWRSRCACAALARGGG